MNRVILGKFNPTAVSRNMNFHVCRCVDGEEDWMHHTLEVVSLLLQVVPSRESYSYHLDVSSELYWF